ncbi:hypothetical protein CYMTET_50314 [Cymbomonas tetramitiformis]|uniref:NADH:ubiquinone oxidoreductase intermediate-associated protein 30 domain-containing protein n=1 Tax=Cymbomonas tetramitiformis TaxID=36881 RepID=A0AAE0ETL9_9CHLO|nr:hypothetical protein CYMTET_50314 [Cymbomonas tetramitiformis]|eukprot:gene7315-8709_t
MKLLLFLAFALRMAHAELVKLATFDGAEGTTYKWKDLNDPVMGGQSVSTLTMANSTAIFDGTCKIVPSLKAPGFCKISASHGGLFTNFPDMGKFLNGTYQLRARSLTPFSGFHASFAARGLPRNVNIPFGSFKSKFTLEGEDWQIVKIPLNEFSYDWSSYTGDCDTKDPTGYQHRCCSTTPEVCPTLKYLSVISDLEIWAEGSEGAFHLEIDWIGFGSEESAVATS